MMGIGSVEDEVLGGKEGGGRGGKHYDRVEKWSGEGYV